MTQSPRHSKYLQLLIGIIVIYIPIIAGSIMWTDIKNTQLFNRKKDSNYHIYHDVDGRIAEVALSSQKLFEDKYPAAKICLTVQGRDYRIPLDKIDEFMTHYGDKARLSVLENRELVPHLSIHKVPGY